MSSEKCTAMIATACVRNAVIHCFPTIWVFMLIHDAIHVTSTVCSVCCHVTILSLSELLLVCCTSGPVLEVCLLLVPRIDRLVH